MDDQQQRQQQRAVLDALKDCLFLLQQLQRRPGVVQKRAIAAIAKVDGHDPALASTEPKP